MLIQDLWICQKIGIVIFSYVKKEKVNSDLFGAMITALNGYAKSLSEGGLYSFDIEEMRITLMEKKELIFIAKSLKKIKIKKIEKELNKIAKLFFERYPEDQFKELYRQPNLFKDFQKELEKI